MRIGIRLRRIVGCAALALVGVVAAFAAGPGFGAIALPTLPTVTVPTVTVPPPPVTLPSPPPPVTLPHVTPPPPPPPPPSPQPSPPASPPPAGPPPARSPSGTSSATGSGTTSQHSGTAVPRARTRQPHRLGRHGSTVFVFDLEGAGPVRFVVRRAGCGTVGSFTVPGRAGVNRIRFHGRIDGRRLAPGTYRIVARHGRTTVLQTTLIVAGGGSGCLGGSVGATGTGSSTAGGGSTGSAASGSAPSGGSGKPSASRVHKKSGGSHAPREAGVLGARVSKVLPGSGGTQLALVIVLAAAIFLLALGALPRQAVPHSGFAAFLARRRPLFAIAGLTALTAFLVSYFIA